MKGKKGPEMWVGKISLKYSEHLAVIAILRFQLNIPDLQYQTFSQKSISRCMKEISNFQVFTDNFFCFFSLPMCKIYF